MVVLDEKGKIRVWMTEDFHLNPFNSLSEMISEVKTEKEALRAILHLVRNKCL